MKKTNKAEEFEQQIARIYDLLVNNSAEVTWNDKIPDPDNTKQLRQVDITLINNQITTHIECRSHKRPQDVKWIEELYGRKISLNATSMIAVSDSGFTEGAIKKAKKLGVFLRRMDELSIQEINKWGVNTNLLIYFYHFTNLNIQFVFDDTDGITLQELSEELHKKTHYIDRIVNEVRYQFNREKSYHAPYCFRFDVETNGVNLCNKKVVAVKISGELDELIHKHNLPSIHVYKATDSELNHSIAKVEKSNQFNLEIIKSGSRLTAIHFNLSSLPQAPPGMILSGTFKFDHIPVDINNPRPPKIELVGNGEQKVCLTGAKISMASRHDFDRN